MAKVAKILLAMEREMVGSLHVCVCVCVCVRVYNFMHMYLL